MYFDPMQKVIHNGNPYMRCFVCDRSDNGLSTFRPDGNYTSRHFHESDGKYYCDECEGSYSESMGDYYENDLEREEQDDAFDYVETGDDT